MFQISVYQEIKTGRSCQEDSEYLVLFTKGKQVGRYVTSAKLRETSGIPRTGNDAKFIAGVGRKNSSSMCALYITSCITLPAFTLHRAFSLRKKGFFCSVGEKGSWKGSDKSLMKEKVQQSDEEDPP